LGVTVHAARAWEWLEVAQGADKQGPLAGVAYDGRLTRTDGNGQWWEGMDPQDLYSQDHKPGEKPDAAYVDKFYLRVRDLIDSYHPDLLYFDDSVMPLNDVSDAGLHVAAHYYNSSARRHGGHGQAVMTTKGLNEEQRRCLVWDIERGKSDRIEPHPWQTDTCIGDWHYLRRLYERHEYKTPETVVHMLVDIVSKNGNLLLNIPVRGDGTIDPDEEAFVREMARWMQVNGEAIDGTRPWRIFGEGPSASPAQPGREANFNEGRAPRFTAQDLRFTAKGDSLYAIALGWPDDLRLAVRALAEHPAGGRVTEVRLLGHDGRLEWSQTAEGLSVKLPEKKPCEHAISLRIAGRGLEPAD
jgi:alpha-L-fucosidase